MERDMHLARVQGWRHWHRTDVPIRLGVSSCLLGQEVRFDGGHSRDRWVTDVLGTLAQWVPVCPEMGIGMGSPRPTIRLALQDEGLRLIAPSTGADYTEAMTEYATTRLAQIDTPALDGYVLKKNSPTCGMERLPIYKGAMKVSKDGVGVYARVMAETYPDLPMEEDGRLNDPRLREAFIERVFCRNRWRAVVASGLTRQKLVEFHTSHKLLLRAHDELSYQRLGTLVGSAGTMPDAELFDQYGREYLHCIAQKASVKRHVNVMQHVMGYFKKVLSSEDKQHLNETIEDYRQGLVPLVVPLTLLRFNAEQHRETYLLTQIYFDPYPKEWMLRNFT